MSSVLDGSQPVGHDLTRDIQVDHPSGLAECRICRDEDNITNLLSPCKCMGSMKYIHFDCLVKCVETKNATTCDICLATFAHIKTHTLQRTFPEFLHENPEFRTELIFAVMMVVLIQISLVCQLLRDEGNDKCSLWLQALVLATFIGFYTGYLFHFYNEWLMENVRVQVIKPVTS